ncbi:MAG: hypothetical protein QNK11_00220, partial [Legionella sp.]|nr:hypothetical protein [Legionella sp.]
FSESANKILRRKSMNKLHSYQLMYQTIAEDMKFGLHCDALDALFLTNRLMLDLEAKLFPHLATKSLKETA